MEVSLDNVTGASLLVRGVTLGDGGLYKCEVTWLDVSQHPSCQQRVVQLVRVNTLAPPASLAIMHGDQR